MVIRGIDGTENVTLCRVCAKESVICAIMWCTRYVVTQWFITDYVHPLALPFPFPFFSSFYGTKKESPRTRAHKKELYRGRIWGRCFMTD